MPASFRVTSAEDPVSVVGAPLCPGDDVSGQRLTGAARVSKAVLTSVQRETTAVRHPPNIHAARHAYALLTSVHICAHRLGDLGLELEMAFRAKKHA